MPFPNLQPPPLNRVICTAGVFFSCLDGVVWKKAFPKQDPSPPYSLTLLAAPPPPPPNIDNVLKGLAVVYVYINVYLSYTRCFSLQIFVTQFPVPYSTEHGIAMNGLNSQEHAWSNPLVSFSWTGYQIGKSKDLTVLWVGVQCSERAFCYTWQERYIADACILRKGG